MPIAFAHCKVSLHLMAARTRNKMGYWQANIKTNEMSSSHFAACSRKHQPSSRCPFHCLCQIWQVLICFQPQERPGAWSVTKLIVTGTVDWRFSTSVKLSCLAFMHSSTLYSTSKLTNDSSIIWPWDTLLEQKLSVQNNLDMLGCDPVQRVHEDIKCARFMATPL